MKYVTSFTTRDNIDGFVQSEENAGSRLASWVEFEVEGVRVVRRLGLLDASVVFNVRFIGSR